MCPDQSFPVVAVSLAGRARPPFWSRMRVGRLFVMLLAAAPLLLVGCEALVLGVGVRLVLTGAPVGVEGGVPVNFTLTITAENSEGAVVSDYAATIRFSSSDAGAVLPPDVTMSASDGGTIAVPLTVTFSTLGTQTLSAFDLAESDVTGSVSIGVFEPATQLEISGVPTPYHQGTTASMTVTARTAGGAIAGAYQGTIHFTSTDSSATLPTDYTFTLADAGARTFPGGLTLMTLGSRSVTATDTAAPSITGSVTVNVVPPPAEFFDVEVVPDPAVRTRPWGVVVTARNASGIITNYAGTVAISCSDPAAVLPSSYTYQPSDNGSRQFPITFNTLGTQTVTAFEVATPTITGMDTVDVVPFLPERLDMTGLASPVTSGTPHTITVTARPQSGPAVAIDYVGTVRFTSSDPFAALPPDYTFLPSDAGIKMFSGIQLFSPGVQSVTVTDIADPGLTDSMSATIVAGAGNSLQWKIQPGTGSTVGAMTPGAQVAILDTLGFRVNDSTDVVTITLKTNPTGATLTGTTVRMAAAGLCIFNDLSVSLAGSGYTLEASAPGFTPIESLPFDVVASTGPTPEVVGVTPPPIMTGCVDIAYALRQEAGQRVNVTFEYDAGGGFLPCTMAPATGNADGRINLRTSPAATGWPHVFRWDSSRDLPRVRNTAVQLRVVATFGAMSSAPVVPTGLTLDNTFSLAAPVTTATSAEPRGIASADFDRDGIVDIAVADNAGAQVHVLSGDGIGGFAAPTAVTAAAGPNGLASADFNRDGWPDLAVACSTASEVVILLNTGTFAATPIAVGTGPAGIAIADINRDGRPDIVTANTTGGSYSVLLNTTPQGATTPTFAVTSQPLGSAPESIALADLDRNGTPDLVITDAATDRVEILGGNGDGTFSAGSAITTLTDPRDIVIADLNRDGRLDIAIAGEGDNQIATFLGNATLTFTPGPTTALAAAYRLAAADLDRDTIPDLVAAGRAAATAQVLLGDGTGAFTADNDSPATADVQALALLDLNRDGHPDLTATSRTSGGLRAALSTTPPSPCSNGFNTPVAYAAAQAGDGLVLADLNGDGSLDAASTAQGLDRVHLLWGDSVGGFELAESLQTPGRPRFPAVGDVNGDGALDIVIAAELAGVRVLIGDGLGGFEPVLPDLGFLDPRWAELGDLNGDGNLDIVTANSNFDNVAVCIGDGTGRFAAPVYYAVLDRPRCVRIADFDGVNGPDIIVANFGSASVSILRNSGSGTFPQRNDFATDSNPVAIDVADVNGDLWPDVVVTCSSSINIRVNNLSGGLTGGSDYTGFAQHAIFARINGDAHVDIVGISGLALTIRFGAGNGTFPTSQTVKPNAGAWLLADADLNEDGNVDIAGVRGDGVTAWLGDGTGLPISAIEFASSLLRDVNLADVNGDGVLDLLTSHAGADHLRVRLGDGSGGFGPESQFTSNHAWSFAVHDVNRDGAPDVAFAGGSGQLMVYPGNNTGAFPSVLFFSTGGNPYREMVLPDLDGNGLPDAVLTCEATDELRILLATGTAGGVAAYGPATAVAFAPGSQPTHIATGDLNRDGRPDVAVACTGSDEVVVLLGDGTGGLTPMTPIALPSLTSVRIGDVDRDGRLDVVATDTNGTRVTVLYGDGAGGVASQASTNLDAQALSMELVDFDGDAILDVVWTNNWRVGVLFGDGTGFGPRELRLAVEGGIALAVGDLDRDGRSDIATLGSPINETVITVVRQR